MNENDIKRIYASIDDLDDQYRNLSESIAMLRVTTDGLNIDNKAVNTSIHNLSLSIGALKERTDSIVSSLKLLAESKDERIDSALRESGYRFSDFRSLCDSRVAATDTKFSMVKTYIDAEVSKISVAIAAIEEEISAINSTLKEYKNKIQYGMYLLILNLGSIAIWLAKLYAETKGWL